MMHLTFIASCSSVQTLIRTWRISPGRIYYIKLHLPHVGLHQYYAINVSDVNLVLYYFRNKRLIHSRGLNCGRSLTEYGGNRELWNRFELGRTILLQRKYCCFAGKSVTYRRWNTYTCVYIYIYIYIIYVCVYVYAVPHLARITNNENSRLFFPRGSQGISKLFTFSTDGLLSSAECWQ